MRYSKHFLDWLDTYFEKHTENVSAKRIEMLYRAEYPRSAKTYAQITCILPRYKKLARADFKENVYLWNLIERVPNPLPPSRAPKEIKMEDIEYD